MDARILLSKEEYVRGMEQRENFVTAKDVQIKLGTVKCATGMGQRRDSVAPTDAQIS